MIEIKKTTNKIFTSTYEREEKIPTRISTPVVTVNRKFTNENFS